MNEMRKLMEAVRPLFESVAPYYYHATFSNKVPSIQKSGLKPLQASNWKHAGSGERYNQEGGVFAFEHPEDAWRWAFRMKFDFDKPVSIVRIQKSDSWQTDPSQDISLQMGKGRALRSMGAIPPEHIVDAIDLSEFSNPSELGISQQEWIDSIVKELIK